VLGPQVLMRASTSRRRSAVWGGARDGGERDRRAISPDPSPGSTVRTLLSRPCVNDAAFDGGSRLCGLVLVASAQSSNRNGQQCRRIGKAAAVSAVLRCRVGDIRKVGGVPAADGIGRGG